jgi:hypothetical protein
MDWYYWLIIVSSAGISSLLLASLAECIFRNMVFTSIEGACGGAAGQFVGRSLAEISTRRTETSNDIWLSSREVARLYRCYEVQSQFILVGAILFGFLLGCAINLCGYRWCNHRTATGLDVRQANEFERS